MIFTDQLNKQLSLKEIPKRIVSLVPSQTELLVDLGLRDAIVGVTKFCIHPPDLRKEKTIVGGTKNVNIGKIMALQPDIILCNKEENSLEIVESLKGIAPVHISDIYNLDDAFELFKMYGYIFKVEEKVSLLISKIKEERSRFQSIVKNQPKRKAAYFIWRNPWMVAASNTFIDAMLREANFSNVFGSESRYPEIDLSHPKLNEADIIMLSSEPYPFKNKHIKELKGLFPEKTIQLVDGELFSWYGSRLQKSYNYFNDI
ncbi:ABC-type Fe3+-hydroxamate transport system substrate-binding protein [Winogradskyella wandonensis]|uniref:ABC-type Fe3+-hydroxamate transport system substrate-binding protein n=1 Tax=Winogradskyella wandonensis TaxID=1442586 RepID=A0A4R1KU19_9FLAO|nr:helical backbone metal receptor [Winogradskyella wandonensis]TCK68696.1 ABC-type Fe3+-hydroxamate transport system substrate-binding protein [Winogradskyella wandonensis]